MINIYIGHNRLDFQGSITYEIQDNLFTKIGEEIAPHTYTLTLPNTTNNVRIFDLCQFTYNKPIKAVARIDIDGIEICKGDMVVQGWDKSGYKVYFVEKRKPTAFDKMMQDKQTINYKIERDLGRINPYLSAKGAAGRWLSAEQNVGVFWYAQWNKLPFFIGEYYKPIIKMSFITDAILDAYDLQSYQLPEKVTRYFSNKYIIPQDYHNIVEDDVKTDIDIRASLPNITAGEWMNAIAGIVGMKIIDGKFIDVSTATKNNLPYIEVNEIEGISYDGQIINGRLGYKGVDHLQFGTSDKYYYQFPIEHPFSLTIPNFDSTSFTENVAGVTNKTEFPSIVMFNRNSIQVKSSASDEVIFVGFVQAETTLALLNDISTLADRNCFDLYTKTKCQLNIKKKLNVVEFQQIKGRSAIYVENVGICYVKKLQYNGDVCKFELVKC